MGLRGKKNHEIVILWLMINMNVYHIILENIFRDRLLRGTRMFIIESTNV